MNDVIERNDMVKQWSNLEGKLAKIGKEEEEGGGKSKGRSEPVRRQA